MRPFALLMLPVLLCGAAPAPTPATVTYVLGGVVSGPYRLAADLRAGTAEEALPPRGKFGDGARLDPWTMPATSHRRLSARDRAAIGTLASAILADGIVSPVRCPITAPPPPPDALVVFAVGMSPGAEPRRLSTASQCLTDDASRLQQLLRNAAQP